jgi:hypothetical protein
MSPGQATFSEQLEALVGQLTRLDGGRVTFRYTIECGPFIGEQVIVGLEIPADAPLNPPHGPHVSPRLLTKPGVTPQQGGIHQNSPFGPDFEHWSRPMNGWASTKRTGREYLGHLRRIFDTIR